LHYIVAGMRNPFVDEGSSVCSGMISPTSLTEAPRPLVLDEAMVTLYEALTTMGPTSLSVLVIGETGTGKEVAAEWLHACSSRRDRQLLKFNCAGLTDSIVESELFGHERGAFTGAHRAHEGFFEAADGGTLFLDEVGELSLRTQAKILRVLDRGELVRLGSNGTRRVDVRFVAATHRDLGALVARGEFREDLLYRLSGATFAIPPLRARPAEILPLATHFLTLAARKAGRAAPRLEESAQHALMQHSWPGNVRELRNMVERAVALCKDGIVEARHLGLAGAARDTSQRAHPPSAPCPATTSMRAQLQAFERARVVAALESTTGNQTKAAALLGISRRTLTNKLNAYGLERPRKRAPG
jgi:DNA-binding NtrC family response regulator